jgi:flavin-dependent dehydrogenase
MIHRPDAARHTLAESLPSSTRKLLRFLGRLDRVEAAGFYPNSGNLVHWAGKARSTATAEPGFHVSRSEFDAVIRAGAREAGVRIIEGTVRQVDQTTSPRVTCSTNAGTIVCDAQYALDCSGRAGVIARRGLRRLAPGYRTMAIVAEWECPAWPAHERALTTVESYADGWAWSVPLSDTRRQCTVMIDTERARSLDRMYTTEVAATHGLKEHLAGARRVSAPWSCDSSVYDSSRAADGRFLLVGDAASFIEPLSSAGVKKALVSAWRAAVVANTCVTNSSMTGAAIDLHVRRETEVYADCGRRSATFFSEAAASYGTPFWTVRAESRTSIGGSAGSSSDMLGDGALSADTGIRDAFERLRRATRVRPSPALQYKSGPVIDGREVVMRDAIVVPGHDSPLQFAAGVDLVRLARIATTCDEVPAIIDAYQRNVGPISAGGLLTGLSLLVARRALVAEDSTS